MAEFKDVIPLLSPQYTEYLFLLGCVAFVRNC